MYVFFPSKEIQNNRFSLNWFAVQTHRAFAATYKFEDLPKLVVAEMRQARELFTLPWTRPRKNKRNVAGMEADKIKNFLIYSFFIANNSTLLALPICGPPAHHSLQIT